MRKKRGSRAENTAVGIAVALAGVVVSPMIVPSAQAQSYSVIYSFDGTSGSEPTGVIADASGNLYGTTELGGEYGYGTVWELPATGGEKVLYSFTGGADGANPLFGGLLRDSAGNLYGVTAYGDNFADTCIGNGCGVVFRVGSTGREKTLYSFTGGADGSEPIGRLIPDAEGNLYGTAALGGELNAPCSSYGCGVVFKVQPDGQETPLYSFTGEADGSSPAGGVVRDSAGNLYGTASAGGTFAYGTVFEVSASGSETSLYTFTGGADGGLPGFGVIRDAAGDLYGVATEADDPSCLNGYCGLVFDVSPAGGETVLYTFSDETSGVAGGYSPGGGLLRDSEGNLYGTTFYGGSHSGSCALEGCGVVFKLSPVGAETVLHRFAGPATDGALPLANLTLYDGYLYGTTEQGGEDYDGAVFRVKP